jgi:hypothetical protein
LFNEIIFFFKGVIAIDDISFDDGACNKAICDFETPEICGYLNDPAGDFDWTRNKGPTASFGTGYFFLNFYLKKSNRNLIKLKCLKIKTKHGSYTRNSIGTFYVY